MKKRNDAIKFRIPSDLKQRFKDQCNTADVSMSDVLNLLIIEHLANNQPIENE